MSNWSFIKKSGEITFEDFLFFARQFCDSVDCNYGSPSRVTVVFYKEIPCSVTTLEQETNKWLAEENKKNQLAEVVGLNNATKELFDEAVNVKLVILPENEDDAPFCTMGILECKGLFNDRFVYYVQPEKVCQPVKEFHLNEQNPSELGFEVGDGYEHCHHVSMMS